MEKNWLIRTKSNHILGPVSKEKVLELFHNGSIKPDDEVCSGNGYWFFIREEELVARFLLGSEVQSFNPISEAKDVITQSQNQSGSYEPDDITLVGGINLAMLKQDPPSAPPVPIPAASTPKPAVQKADAVSPETKKKNNLDSNRRSRETPPPSTKPLKKQNWLKYVSFLGFLVLFLLIYFRKTIIQHIFKGELTAVEFSFLNEAHAQEDLPGKKKSF